MRVQLTRRRAVHAALAALLVAATVAASQSSAAPRTRTTSERVPALHGLMRIDATHPSRAYVALPKAVALRQQPPLVGFFEGLTIHGAGRIYGMSFADEHGRRGFVAMHYNPCFTRGCVHGAHGDDPADMLISWDVTAPIDQPVDAPLRLPAGRYVVSVFTDGAPVHVRWRIPGLGGSGRLRLHTPQNLTVDSPADSVPAAGPVRTESQFSGSATLDTDVVVLAEADLVAKNAHVTNDSSWCIYSDPPPGDRPLPECAGGSGTSIGMTYVSLKSSGMGYGLGVLAGPGSAGRYLQSVDDSGVQAISDAHANLLWADGGWQTQ